MSLRNGKTYSSTTTVDRSDEIRNREDLALTYPTRPSPYLLLVYPVIIALGSAFFYISPSNRTNTAGPVQPLTPGIASDQYAHAHTHTLSYFARKSNIFNQYFVKIGWVWTTLAFATLRVIVQYSSSNVRATSQASRSRNKTSSRRAAQLIPAILRYLLITSFWIFTTQWFFGPALIDRSFVLTGGKCEAVPTDPILPSGATTDKINKLPTLLSAAVCKAGGGRWRGGHDISGHVFMLVLSSAFLLYELVHIENALPRPHPNISDTAAANISKTTTEEEKKALGGWESQEEALLKIWGRRFVYTVIGLDLWMLMMTAVFFHTWLEKLSGLMLAGASLYTVYFLGDFLPAWRNVVG